MALKLRKEIKKSSYYVWFLGAKESKGLRGADFILPVIKHLEQREKDIEPFKVTLQVSHKGLKIIQNIQATPPNATKKNKNDIIKHFIPHNTISYVYQHEDVIACILLLFNPVTKCPLHVHAYRCDSLETASVLKQQLQMIIERPENQKKFAEIEGRLKMEQRKEAKKGESSVGSDTGTSTRESESSEERFAVENSRVTNLYDSVAAELREKLAKNNVPILLPPRDYDTVHRAKGNLTGIELRRCLNANIVGQNVKGRKLESSGASSGIGSDHPPSPDSPDAPDSRFNTLDNHSTSDEDWNGDTAESTVYLTPQVAQKPAEKIKPQNTTRELKYLEKPIAKYGEKLERQKSNNHHHNKAYFFEEENEEQYHQKGEKSYQSQTNQRPVEKSYKYFEDDGFDEKIRYRNRYHPDPYKDYTPPVAKTRQKYPPNLIQRTPSPPASPRDRFKDAKEKFLSMEKERLIQHHEPPISPIANKSFLKRHESLMFESRPKPAPRRDVPLERYRNSDKYDPKRRSMFSLVEEEHRKHSGDIAKELKRRSYIEEKAAERRDFSKSSNELEHAGELGKFKGAGYRHSYAEQPKIRLEKMGGNRGGKSFDVLHRTNSVTNNGRVGIASLHPY